MNKKPYSGYNSTCPCGKVQYEKEKKAVEMLVRSVCKGRTEKGDVYKCKMCLKYHVTHNPERNVTLYDWLKNETFEKNYHRFKYLPGYINPLEI